MRSTGYTYLIGLLGGIKARFRWTSAPLLPFPPIGHHVSSDNSLLTTYRAELWPADEAECFKQPPAALLTHKMPRPRITRGRAFWWFVVASIQNVNLFRCQSSIAGLPHVNEVMTSRTSGIVL